VEVHFRVDADAATGLGHLRRCLSLAAAITAGGGTCRFFMSEPSIAVAALVRDRGVSLCPLAASSAADAAAYLAAAEGLTADWLIVDHYGLGASWREALRAARTALRIGMVVDCAGDVEACDLLIDPNMGMRAGDYAQRVSPGCRICAGERFALLDPRFLRARERLLAGELPAPEHTLLVSLGGGDCQADLAAVADSLERVAAAGAYRWQLLRGPALPAGVSPEFPRFEVLPPEHDMAALLCRTAAVIGAGGVSALERLCLGVPALCIERVGNQAGFLTEADGDGLIRLLPGYWRLAPDERVPAITAALTQWLPTLAQQPRRPHRGVDGRGADRVAAVMADVA
jgi:UDP-2,4-diacetamido-2,4,6-trideoxy-beta-L-altropyranose hydrolase